MAVVLICGDAHQIADELVTVTCLHEILAKHQEKREMEIVSNNRIFLYISSNFL